MKHKTPEKIDFERLAQESRRHDQYWISLATYDFLEQIHEAMESAKISRTELASRLFASPAYITKIFRGDTNFTLETMIKLARRVGCKLEISLKPESQLFDMEGTNEVCTASLTTKSVVKPHSYDYRIGETAPRLQQTETEVPTHELPIPA
jgi:transcriptional regulator with XRE-family HTH domain